jgi:hypothetical protein
MKKRRAKIRRRMSDWERLEALEEALGRDFDDEADDDESEEYWTREADDWGDEFDDRQRS